jgi:F-type H+-transporting ATPase subunit epsilon
VAADSSGQFGLLAGAEPIIAALRFGLARFKPANEPWHYVALPSGVLQFDGNQAVITTTHFLVDTNREAMSEALEKQIAAAEHAVSSTRQMITNIEHALMKKLWEMRRQA